MIARTVAMSAALAMLVAAVPAAAADNDADMIAAPSAGVVEAALLASRADLGLQGYRGVMPVNGDPFRLLATDPWGTEVAIRIDPGTGEVNGIHPFHPADR